MMIILDKDDDDALLAVFLYIRRHTLVPSRHVFTTSILRLRRQVPSLINPIT